MFVFLLGRVYFLLLFLLTTLEVAGDVQVAVFAQGQQFGSGIDAFSLTDQSAID